MPKETNLFHVCFKYLKGRYGLSNLKMYFVCMNNCTACSDFRFPIFVLPIPAQHVTFDEGPNENVMLFLFLFVPGLNKGINLRAILFVSQKVAESLFFTFLSITEVAIIKQRNPDILYVRELLFKLK